MKVGDLVRDPCDGDIGIIVNFVDFECEDTLSETAGGPCMCDFCDVFPIIEWVKFGIDDTIPVEELEIINESR